MFQAGNVEIQLASSRLKSLLADLYYLPVGSKNVANTPGRCLRGDLANFKLISMRTSAIQRKALLSCFLYLLGWVMVNSTFAQPANKIDVATIMRNSELTQAQMQRETFSWTSVFELPVQGASFHVDNTLSANGREMTVTIRQGTQSQQVASIVARDGVWYVAEEGMLSKYRPFEAPLAVPSLYLYLDRTDRFLVDAQTLAAARLESVKGNVATFRLPLVDATRQQIQTVINMYENAQQLAPGREIGASETQIAIFRDMLAHGAPCIIEVDTGIVVESGMPGRRMMVRDVKRSPPENLAPLPNALSNAVDRTSSLLDSVRTLDDLVLMGHARAWNPGQPLMDTDTVVLNLRNGALRRIPYPMAGTGPSCFSKDRRSVFISGLVGDQGVLGLFQIDLATGTTRRLGEQALGGITMFPALSPDGRTLAVITKGVKEKGVLDTQVCLIDVESGNVAKVGEPLDTASLSWLPDQAGLVLVTRKQVDLDEPAEETIARMEFNGRVVPIRKGSSPLVLLSEQRILFEDREDGKWKTCDFQGQNVRTLGDGLSGYGFPTVSPDESQLIMMRFSKTTGPRPYFVELATGRTTPLGVGRGLWAYPRWR